MPYFTPSKANKFIIDFDRYQPVKVISCCHSDGTFTPLRVKITAPDKTEETYDINGITQTKDIPNGVSFRCFITCFGRQQAITLIFYYEDHVCVTPINQLPLSQSVYTHTFKEDREMVDATINNYFETIIGINKKDEDIDVKKYKAWLLLFDKIENDDTINEFKAYMQHEMQHKK